MMRSARWLACAAVTSVVAAQPANELVDPEHALHRVFPEATSYRAIVRDVDQEARSVVQARLPFRVHFNEFGAHALYVGFRARRPVGLMYLRAEATRWGFSEIGWGFTTDGRVVDFWFQRGRSRYRTQLEQSPFSRLIKGKSFDELVVLLQRLEGGDDLAAVPAGAEELAVTVLRSALKAQAVMAAVWQDEIQKLDDLAMGFDAFPTAETFRREVVRFDPGEKARALRAVRVMSARSRGHVSLGAVVHTEFVLDGDAIALRWILDVDRQVIGIRSHPQSSDLKVRRLCAELEGLELAASDGTLGTASEFATVLATELGSVLHGLDRELAPK